VLVGPGAAVITAGAAVTAGTVVYATGPRIAATAGRVRTAGIDPWRPGGAAAMRSRGLRAMVLVYAAIAMTFGAFDLFAAAIAEAAGRPSLAGGLISIIAAASLVSGFVYGARIWSGSLAERMLRLLLVFLGALILLPVVAGDLLLVALVLAFSGTLIGPMNVCGFQLIDDVAPASARAEAQSWTQAAIYLGGSIGGVIAGVVIELFGTRATMSVGVVGVALASAVLRGAPSLRDLGGGAGPARTVEPIAPVG
jgi:predicted MFS family arabinose efflux permease